MGGGLGGGAASAAGCALRLLLLLVLALTVVEYFFGFILDENMRRSYLHFSGQNSSPAPSKNDKWPPRWPKRILADPDRPKNATYSSHGNTTRTSPRDAKNNTNADPNLNKSNSTKSTTDIKLAENATVSTNTSVTDTITSTPKLINKIVESLMNFMTTIPSKRSVKRNKQANQKLCPAMPPDLGPTAVNKSDMNLSSVEKKFREVVSGGRYMPPHCKPRHRVAIIVPYRDRQQHLAIFLNHMHPFLMKQQIEYGIFIIEQAGESDFNRAKLMNVGFAESEKLKTGGWQCFVFHDIDLLPLDGRNLYSCPRQPRHMSAAIDKWHNKLPYVELFGGVSALTKQQFVKVNGFSNKYWGWGGEDDDMCYRLKKSNFHIARYKMSIARYTTLDHKKSSPNPKRFQLLSQTGKTFLKDGLTTLKYEVVSIKQHHLYTHIVVNIDERS